MKIKGYQKIPFYGNTPDGVHCFQAVMKMILGYFFPNEQYAWSDLNKITHHPPNKWTWAMAGLIYLKNRGLVVKHIVKFDYEALSSEGLSYLQRIWKPEYYREQIKHSDMDSVLVDCREYAKTKIQDRRNPTMTDIRNLLADDYLVICNLNGKKLHGLTGYAGHFVLLFGITKDTVVMHNPGLPATANLSVDIKLFEEAWRDGMEIIAVKAESLNAYL